LRLFHEDGGRDSELFGGFDEEGNYFGNVDQKNNCVAQGCLDVIKTLDKITKAQQRFTVDYAIWYREKFNGLRSYSQYITRITCHCIAHSQFFAGQVQYELTEF